MSESPRVPRHSTYADELMRRAIDALPHAMAVLDDHGRVVTANPRWEGLTGGPDGTDPAELVAMTPTASFIDACAAQGETHPAWSALAQGVRAVLTGSELSFRRDIPSPSRLRTLTEGVLDLTAPVRWFDILVERLDHSGAPGAAVLCSEVTDRKRIENDLAHAATHDPLTGLANRSLFTDRLNHALRRGDRSSPEVALLMIDLDHFKAINDTYGHVEADAVLVALASRLAASSRPGDTVARLGGDEFAIICENVSDARTAMRIGLRLIAQAATPMMVSSGELTITLSMGIALSRPDEADARLLTQQADTALYRAKVAGRNRVELFDEVLRSEVTGRINLERDLRRGVEQGEFRVFYQPTVDIPSGRVVGAEALVRWEHPTRGLVMPDRFIPAAEETGIIMGLGRWILHEACREAVAWSDPDMVVSVNLSGRQVLDPDLVATVTEALATSGLDPWRLCLEITESVLIDDGTAASKLSALRELGVHIALDDFGTGFSSLSYLHRFPVDTVKIDRSFIEGLGTDPDSGVIVSAIVSMSGALGIQVVAEGVETEAQLHALAALGSTRAQGFYFHQPLTPADFAERILAGR